MKILDNSWLGDISFAEVIPHHGRSGVIKEGGRLFDVPSLIFQSTIHNVPRELDNAPIVYTNPYAGMGMRVTEAGWVFFITEEEPEKPDYRGFMFYLNHRMGGIFKKLAIFDEGELLPGHQAKLWLVGAYCKEGLDFQCAIIRDALAVVLARINPSYVPTTPEDQFEENLAASLKTITPLVGEALKAELDYYCPDNRGFSAIPEVAVTSEGTLYTGIMCAPFGRLFCGGENYYGYTAVARSRDGGITWEDPVAIFDPDKEGPARAFEPVVWTDETGKRLYLAFVQGAGTDSNFSGRMGAWMTYCDNPEDDVPVFCEPYRVFDGFFDDPPQKFSDGYWYAVPYFTRNFPLQYYKDANHDFGPRIYRSLDLRNWEFICTIPNCETDTTEPTMVECEPGKVLLIERNKSGSRYTTASLSDMSKWSAPKTLRYDNNDEQSQMMQTVYSRNNLFRMPSGNLLLVYHNNNTQIRDNLTVALSEDGGVTWPYKLLLDERALSSYGQLTINTRGEVLAVYDQGRGRSVKNEGSELLMARFTEDDVKAGELLGARSVRKRLVSRYGLPPRKPCFDEQILAAERIKKAYPQSADKIDAAIKTAVSEPTLENYQNLCRVCDEITE